jgi:hypothetical protein
MGSRVPADTGPEGDIQLGVIDYRNCPLTMLRCSLKPHRHGYWSALAPAAALVIFYAASAKAVEPAYKTELHGLSEITNISLKDAAKDGCWPNPNVTENLVIARLKAAGLSYGVTPSPEVPEYPEFDDPDYELKFKLLEGRLEKRERWLDKNLAIYVHAYDMSLEVNGVPVPVCVAYVTLKLLGGEDPGHLLLGFLKSQNPELVQESILQLTDLFIAHWVESNE